MPPSIDPSKELSQTEVDQVWQSLEEYMTTSRYAVRDPETGVPLEHNYISMLVNRIIPKLASKDSPLSDNSVFEDLKKALLDRLIIPASPLLMSFGNPYTRRPGYFSCYPLGWVGDSLAEIETMRQRMRFIYMAGGGAGIDISKLRPKGSAVDAGQGVASGPVGFLTDFDAVTGTTNQGGRRRGALLVQMDWNHPDIEDFVKAKNFNSKLNSFIQTLPPEDRPTQSAYLSNMNISVNAFGDFWENSQLIRLISENMWSGGDPGLLFIDNMIRYSPLRKEDEPRFSNPCGEYLASAGTACNLVTINAARLARQSVEQLLSEGISFDSPEWNNKFSKLFFGKIQKSAGLACLLGNLILNFDEGYPLPDIREKTQAMKPVGVGMSGFHTALILAYFGRAVYGDSQSVDFARKTQASLTLGTLLLSAELTRRTGHAYENQDYWGVHLNELEETLSDSPIATTVQSSIGELKQLIEEKGGFYNCLTTSQAPTGSVSTFLRNIDTGIEPFFGLSVDRRILDQKHGWLTKTLTQADLWDLFIRYPDLKERTEAQTALKLTPLQQINMLAAFQYHNHSGVSKTINVPKETTPEEIEKLIYLSRDQRLKGFTLYRDGSLQGIITVSGAKDKKKYTDDDSGVANERESRTFTARSPSLKAHITLSNDRHNNIREVFVTAGDVGADINALFAAFGMILSTALKCEPDLFNPLVNSLCKVRMGERVLLQTMNDELIVGNSLPHALGLLLLKRKAFLDKNKNLEKLDKDLSSFDLCPECQSLSLKRDGSCRKCTNCGFTTC
ncbi:MAG: hypothetical protein LBS44_02150 [Deltaproteobacteria bacterium]|jgi:ribonucleoside-diphosphate reductase alpha chain|nr:hypothetical protein [Deltaproteobacteria bacterium]